MWGDLKPERKKSVDYGTKQYENRGLKQCLHCLVWYEAYIIDLEKKHGKGECVK